MTKTKLTPKLFYEQGKEFYWVNETDKMYTITWVEKLQTDGTPLDQNVKWGHLLKVSKGKSNGNPLHSHSESHLLCYPKQAGQPFYLSLATLNDIDAEILHCKRWGTNTNYYENLKQYVTI